MTMLSRLAIALFLSVLFLPASAAEPVSSGQAGAHASAHRPIRIDYVKGYLDHIHDVIALARSGGYGRIKSADMKRAVAAQEKIDALLANRTDATGLTDDQQLELVNAEETIKAVVRADDKNRVVCTRSSQLGSRLPTRECMTVGQREARAARAREATNDIQRSLGCVRDRVSGQCL